MKSAAGWSTTMGLAALLACLAVTPGRAQAPTPARTPSATRPDLPGRLEPMTLPPPVDPDPKDGVGGPSALPSTVSPAIERYVKQSGRVLPPLRLSPAAAMIERRQEQPSPARATAPLRSGTVSPPLAQAGQPNLRQGAPSLPAPLLPIAQPPRAGIPVTGASPLAFNLKLKSAPLEPTDLRFPINLATALRLADARPLIVASAQASVWVAEAQLTRAKILWVPSVLLGADYIRHDGGGPDINKGVMTFPSANFFYAGPSLYQYVNLTDVIFEPLAARQELNARQWDTQAAKNDALLQTADAYFLVHQYRGMYAGALYTVDLGQDLVDRIASLSSELVSAVEVDRARNFLADLEQRAVMARQEWRVSSANLTQVLRLDPRAVVDPMEHDHTQVTLIDPARSYDDLMPIALTNRPEILSRRALVQRAELTVRREKSRPLLPLIMLNGFQSAGMFIQGGVFALGPNSSLNQWVGRDDVTIQLMWQLENFGMGNLGRIKAQRGNESRTIIELRNAQDRAVAEVTRAVSRLQSAAARVLQADRALRAGIITFNGHLEGLGQTRRLGNVLVLTFRPQEAVYSLDLLSLAFNEYFTTVAEYNRAQFDLYHALGFPAAELARFRPAGEVLPVDTSRPAFLPRVGNGPPAATR